MRRRLLRLSLFALPALFCAYLSAQSVFVLPGLSGNASPTVFTADPFAQTAVVSGTGVNPTFAFAGPNGKFYIVSNNSSATVQSTDSTFATLHTVDVYAGAIAAYITPDSKRLLVESSGGTLNVVDTTADKTIANLSLGGQVIDLAIWLDSSTAYALTSSSSGLHVVIVNLTTGIVGNSVTIAPNGTTGTGISVSPAGLVYVSTQGAIYELDPLTLAKHFTIPVTGIPGRLYFTPDGTTGIAANQSPANGDAIFVINLSTRTVGGSIPATSVNNAVINQLFPVGNNRVIAFSSSAQSLYDITLNPLGIAPFQFGNIGGVNTAAVSNTVPTASSPNTQFLYFTSGSTIYRVDLNSNQVTGQLSLSGTAGNLMFAAAGLTTGTPATLLTFGDNQAIAPNLASQPLVVQVVDNAGHPLAGVTVTFSTSAVGLTFSNATSVTNNLGYAFTTVTASAGQGAATGAATITATAGTLTTNFTVNIGGGGTTNPGGLSILNGQGQVLPAPTNTSQAAGNSLEVQLTDQSGNPVSGQAIQFTLQSGPGAIFASGSSGGIGQPLSVTTSSCAGVTDPCTPGVAYIDFSASSTPGFPGFAVSTISATAPNGSTQTFYVNTVASGANGFNPTTLTLNQEPTTLTLQTGQTLTNAIVGISTYASFPLQNVGLQLVNSSDRTLPPAAICAGTWALSDATGHLSCNVVAKAAPGTYQVTPIIGNSRMFSPITLVINPGAPANATIVSGNNQSGVTGSTLPQPLVIKVTDAGGNPQSNVPVTFTVNPTAAATLTNVSSVTDSNGRASATVKLGTTTGAFTVTAQASGLPAVTFSLTSTVPVAGIQLVSGGGQTAQLGTAFSAPIVVKVVDASGNGISGASVTFTVNNGATLSAATATTNSSGTASTNVTAGSTGGAITVTAQTGTFTTTATLTAVTAGPANLVFLNGAGFNDALAPGSIVAIQGTGLVTNLQGISVPTNIVGPLPTTWQGITVTFNGTAAPIYSVSNVNGTQQVVVQVPYEVGAATSATVVITTPNGGTTTTTVTLKLFAPGIFETTIFGSRQGVALHADGSYVSPTNPAHLGESITMFVEGLGQTNPTTGTNRAGIANQTVIAPVQVGINNAGVNVTSVQAAPGLIGVYAVTFIVPSDATPGTADPLGFIVRDPSGNPYFAPSSFLPVVQP